MADVQVVRTILRSGGVACELVGTVILALASALLAVRGRAGRAALVLAPGTATALVYAFPEASYAWLAFLLLAPAALVAAVSTLAGRAG